MRRDVRAGTRRQASERCTGASAARGRVAALALGAAIVPAALAETAYVIDRLLVGVHEGKELNSAIVKVVPTGTPLEVLEREGELARIETPDGVVGWVDAAYLMAEKPASVRLLDLEARNEATAAALTAARGRVAQLDARVEELESLLAEYRERLEEEMARNEPPEPPPEASEALRQVQTLAEENTRLKETVAALDAAVEELESRPPAPAPRAPRRAEPRERGLLDLEAWQWLLVGSVLLLSFALGGWLVDWTVRRRHGGFRV